MRKMMVSFVACSLLGAAAYADDAKAPSPAGDESKVDGTVTLKGGSVAAGIGFTWGSGELKYGTGSHEFSIKGVSVVDVGATNFTAAGSVYHLTKLADFTGNYVAAGAGVTIAGGGTAVYLRNEHGVVIKLIATEVGLKFNLSADGVHVALKGS